MRANALLEQPARVWSIRCRGGKGLSPQAGPDLRQAGTGRSIAVSRSVQLFIHVKSDLENGCNRPCLLGETQAAWGPGRWSTEMRIDQ